MSVPSAEAHFKFTLEREREREGKNKYNIRRRNNQDTCGMVSIDLILFPILLYISLHNVPDFYLASGQEVDAYALKKNTFCFPMETFGIV